MSNYTIAFSGACHSGKTTFMHHVKDILGDNAVILSEIIRDRINVPIDEIRKDKALYFKTQLSIIADKIIHENEAQKKYDNKIILVDRSLIDSLYYYTFYVDNKSDQKLYFEFLKKLIDIIKSTPNRYDKIILMKPIDPSNNEDPLRPSNIKDIQGSEYEMIKSMTYWFYPQDKIAHYDAKFDTINDLYYCLKPNNSEILSDYRTYKSFIEDKYFLLDDIISNTHGSVTYKQGFNDLMLTSGCLFTLNSYTKTDSDYIIQMINELKVDDEYMNSRCYPTGFFRKSNNMVVGEAPGVYGRAILKDYLKPAFIFAQPSQILRKSIQKWDEVPYITNLLKVARPENSVAQSDFRLSLHIFIEELIRLDPCKIFVLGKNAYNFIMGCDEINKMYKDRVIKYSHPAHPIYTGKINEYIEKFPKP